MCVRQRVCSFACVHDRAQPFGRARQGATNRLRDAPAPEWRFAPPGILSGLPLSPDNDGALPARRSSPRWPRCILSAHRNQRPLNITDDERVACSNQRNMPWKGYRHMKKIVAILKATPQPKDQSLESIVYYR